MADFSPFLTPFLRHLDGSELLAEKESFRRFVLVPTLQERFSSFVSAERGKFILHKGLITNTAASQRPAQCEYCQ